jgi:hypothetical protein
MVYGFLAEKEVMVHPASEQYIAAGASFNLSNSRP